MCQDVALELSLQFSDSKDLVTSGNNIHRSSYKVLPAGYSRVVAKNIKAIDS